MSETTPAYVWWVSPLGGKVSKLHIVRQGTLPSAQYRWTYCGWMKPASDLIPCGRDLVGSADVLCRTCVKLEGRR